MWLKTAGPSVPGKTRSFLEFVISSLRACPPPRGSLMTSVPQRRHSKNDQKMSLQTAPCALRASWRLNFTLAFSSQLPRKMLFLLSALPAPTPRAPGPQVQLGALQMSWQPEGGLESFKMAVPTWEPDSTLVELVFPALFTFKPTKITCQDPCPC